MSTTFQFSTYSCPLQETLTVQIAGLSGQVRGEKETLLFDLHQEGERTFVNLPSDARESHALAVIEALFAQNSAWTSVWLSKACPAVQNLLASESIPTEVSRLEFFQLRNMWVHNGDSQITPEKWTTTKDVAHPIRPRVKAGQLLYSRFYPAIGKTISFRVVDPTKDLETFHNWHNQERVYHFWELNKPQDELREYLDKGLQDPHQFPTFVEFDGVPVGYFEFYWTAEDRLGPYYPADAFDRGLHLLIGNEAYLGFNNTDAILKSACHYLFLEEPRTRKIMAEPRADNKKILRYLETFLAWKNLREFDFPHKRAALLECKREAFFGGNYL